MNENENINLIPQDIESADDAQPVSESELSAIGKAMEYVGDIQPLSDLEEPEFIELDYARTEEAPYEKSKEKSRETKKDIKKKKTARLGGSNKIIRKIIVAVCVVAVLSLAVVGIYFAVTYGNVNKYPVAAVYESEGQTVVRLENGEEYPLGEVDEVNLSEDGMMLYYSVETASKTVRYDVKVIDISKKNSLKNAGSYIDSGVDEGWKVNLSGGLAAYSKTKNGSTDYYLYSSAERNSQEITDNLEEFFLPPNGDTAYFTRRNGEVYSLHCVKFGENAANVQSGISYAQECGSKDGMSVLYTVESEEGNKADVYVVSDGAAPVLVCKDADEFYPQNYTYGGNLYYFTENKSNVDWHDFIADSYYDSDATTEKPLESDYMKEIGFFFKRKVLDTSAYNAAKRRYNEKLLRDDIREALDKIDLGLSAKGEFTCYAYNSSGSHKLATGVALDNIAAFADTGAPRIIYRKAVIDVDSKIDMDRLVEIASDGDASAAVDYVKEKISNSYDVSDDCIYSWYDGSRSLEYTVEGYESDTEFSFGSRSVFYAVADGTLYCNEITASGVGEKRIVDDNVTEYDVYDGTVYFIKDVNGANSLFKFDVAGGKTAIADSIYSHFTVSENYAVVLTNSDSESETMTVGTFDGKKYTQVDTDVNLRGFVCSGENFAYTKSEGNSVANEGSSMYLYTPESGAVKVSDNVTEIIRVGK